MTKLSERAMLVSLHISAWSGMMLDREITDAVNESYKADKQAGRYSKRLVATKFLQPVSSEHNKARQIHRLLTLPWEDDGTRILTASGYMQYTTKMKDARLKVEAATAEFIKGLPDYINEGKQRLGKMFDAADYPSSDDLKGKFAFDVEVKSVPEAGDFRAQLSNDATAAIVKDIEKRSKNRLENAMNDVFQRVVGVVQHMSERLREYAPPKDGERASGIIRDSLVYNIHELAELLPSLNVTDDPRIEQLRKQLLSELLEHSPEILRADVNVRKETISRADKILKKVSGYMA